MPGTNGTTHRVGRTTSAYDRVVTDRRPFPLAAALVALALALVAAGCGGSGGGDGGILDFADAQVGERTVEIAPDGRSAVITLETDPATICAVSYGEDEELGKIANDPGMGGTAITDHSVVLGGLEPNTTYRYRLTATDAQGRVYQTPDVLTLTTTVTGAQRSGRNVASEATVVASSSEYSDAFSAANAVDGDVTTEWSSAGDGDAAFVTIDLGRAVDVAGVAFRTREMADGSAITRTFAVVVDGGRRYGPFPAGDRVDPRTATVAFRGRKLRFEVVDSSGGNTGAAEIEVIAAP